MAISLEDKQMIEKIDSSGLLGVVEQLGTQCEEAAARARGHSLPGGAAVENIVVLGMGGSGISGDIAAALLADDLRVPLATVKGYSLPAFVDKNSLVFAVSYSGDTEETLACFDLAVGKGAKVVAVTSGGELGKRASAAGIDVIGVPAGMQPRAALAYLLMPIVVVLSETGLITDMSADINEAVSVLNGMRPDSSIPKSLANTLYGKIPVIYGSEGALAAAALRWKCQINENSKSPAFHNAFPEMNHNEIVGWDRLADISKGFHLVMLRSPVENDRVRKRIEITLPLIADNLGGITEVRSAGESLLARLLSLVYIGDLASIYLAILYGVDPSPVERIKDLKQQLSK